MKVIRIRSGWFRSAGAQYAWMHAYDIFGVGIDLEALRGNDKIKVVVNGFNYILDCREAIEFINRFHSIKVVGMGKRVGVVSKSILKNESDIIHDVA